MVLVWLSVWSEVQIVCTWTYLLCLGHATGGASVLIRTCCGSGLLRHGLNFSTAWCTTRLNSVKHLKRVLMQKVVTLNTCCDIACLTFQLPHITKFTTGSFESHQWQPTAGSFQSFQRVKECNKPSVWWKSFAVHKLVRWHFQIGWQVDYSLFSSEIT